MQYSGAGGKLIHQKNQKQKISWHCPFKKEGPLNAIPLVLSKSAISGLAINGTS